MLQLAAEGDPGCQRVIADAAAWSAARSPTCATPQPGPSSSAASWPRPATSCWTRCGRRSAATRSRPRATDVAVVAGALGDRAELLGALVLAGHQSDRPRRPARHRRGIDKRRKHSDSAHARTSRGAGRWLAASSRSGVRCRGAAARRQDIVVERRARRRQQQRGKAAARSRAAARHEVLGALGDGRPPAARGRRSTPPASRSRSRTPRATSPTQQQQAEQAITNGAKVILLVNLDSGSGAAIETIAKRAASRSSTTTASRSRASADYYVSFDNVKVGKLQGQGLVDCLARRAAKPRIAELNGSPDDNNATLFAQGYNSVLDPLYKRRQGQEGRRPVRARTGTTRRR